MNPTLASFTEEQENSATLPRPTNRQSRLLLVRMCNRLAISQVRTCRAIPPSGIPHLCVFCHQGIRIGDQYRENRPRSRAHNFCFKAVAREDWGAR